MLQQNLDQGPRDLEPGAEDNQEPNFSNRLFDNILDYNSIQFH